jgi:starvation-inducible DNA-binding protein
MIQLLATRPSEETADAAAPLQETLVELMDLRLQAEQAHWASAGKGSKGIHVFLDQLIDQYHAWHDDLIERLGAIGASSDGRLSTVAAATPLELLPAGELSDRDVVTFFDEKIGREADRVRARLEPVEAVDPVSRDLLAGIARWLDTQGVILSASLAARRRRAG